MDETGIEVLDGPSKEAKESGRAVWQELADAVNDAVTDAGYVLDRLEAAHDTHFCRWEGQSLDGRKHLEDLNKEAFPWENASDTRVRMSEDIVNDECRLLKASDRRAELRFAGVDGEPADDKQAAKAKKVMKWVLATQLKRDRRRECELARQWRQTYGSSVTWVRWHEELGTESKKVTLEGFVQYMAERRASAGEQVDGAQVLEDAHDLVFNDGRKEEFRAVLEEWHPGAAAKGIRELVKSLRKTGAGELAVPFVRKSGPRWRALQVFVDVFFPPEVDDLQDAPWIAVRELVTEAQARDRDLVEDWEDGFLEELLKHKGKSGLGDAWEHNGLRAHTATGWRGPGDESVGRTDEESRDLCELWKVFRRATDTETGVSGIYVTLFSAMVKDMAAVEDELLDYAHGRLPFVEHVREMKVRSIVESRGVPEIVMTWQNEVKTQRDARTDRASIEVQPPVEAPMLAQKNRPVFGPGAVNYTRSPGSFKFMPIGGNASGAVEVEAAVKDDVNWFFGRIAETVPAARRQVYLEGLVDEYMGEQAEVLLQTWQLCQQFLDPNLVRKLVGEDGQQAQQPGGNGHEPVTPEEIRGQFDVSLVVDVRDLDPELQAMKLKMVNEMILPGDVGGVIDRARYTRRLMYMIDPELADEVVQDIGSVQQREVEDEQVQMTKLIAGIEAPMKGEGQNAQLRKQVMEQTIQANPELMQRYNQPDGMFRKLVDARAQHFQHMLDQEQNKQIGRIGVRPVLGGSESEI